MWASTIACSQFHELGGGIEKGYRTLHEIEHPLSGFYDIAHGDGLSALLPSWMRYTLPAREDRFKQLAKNVFGSDDAIKSTEEWLKKVNQNPRLRDLGIEPEKFEAMAESAIKMGFDIPNHPRPLDVPAIVQIYEDAY
jgi:alcohol dehydrogenase YqhD (iron-dependent ADH family)